MAKWWKCFTEAELQETIDELKEAVKNCALGKDVEMEGRKIELPDLKDLQTTLERYCSALAAKTGGNTAGATITRCVPVMNK